MQFLNQNTAVLFGSEMMAHQLNYAVVFYALRKIKRGKYELELFLITDNPSERSWGEITEAHTHLLEQEINNEPAPWLWSHKRWKMNVPENLEKLQKEHIFSSHKKGSIIGGFEISFNRRSVFVYRCYTKVKGFFIN